MDDLIPTTPFIKEFLIKPLKEGTLNDLTFAVKDVFHIKGFKTGCGSPFWQDAQPISTVNAICVDQLLASGAACIGKTITGEFCCGSTGINHFYGMPLNPKAPSLVPGGSSSGSASAVASGKVDFSLGTDAGGSVRVPASFCGIIGMRPTPNRISMSGVQTFVPSFDTVGVFANSMDVMEKVMACLLGEDFVSNSPIKEVYVIKETLESVSKELISDIEEKIHDCCAALNITATYIDLKDIDGQAECLTNGISRTFRDIYCAEFWTTFGSWATQMNLQYGINTYVDLEPMKQINRATLSELMYRREHFAFKLNQFLMPNRLILLPTTPSTAISRPKKLSKVNEFNYNSLRQLTSLSGIGSLPQITLPFMQKNNLPFGLSLLAARYQDSLIIQTAKKLKLS